MDRQQSTQCIQSKLCSVKTIVLDLDGTVYKGNYLIEGVKEAIDNMRKQGLEVVFCTNNSSQLSDTICKKLVRMGIDCQISDIYSSGQLAIDFVKKNGNKNTFIVGSEELVKGFMDQQVMISEENDSEILVIGMDTNFTYDKLKKAIRSALKSKIIV